jgi:hypothetical protein
VVVGASGGGGSSDPTGLGTKIKRKGKKNRKKEKERAALPRSGLLGSRSPSPGGEGRRRSPDLGWKQECEFRPGWVLLSLEVSRVYPRSSVLITP